MLGLHVFAKGIETAKQLARLKAARCDFGQGHLFSKPLPAGEFGAAFARARQPVSAQVKSVSYA
jgi:EAL domain-containing protein (putative c-di-GMP-specific phosphodiesterase class I)